MLYFSAESFPQFRSLNVEIIGSVVIFTMARNCGHLTSRRKRGVEMTLKA